MKRGKFNLSHYVLGTGFMGRLYPVGNVEVMPGDTFRHQTSVLLRLTPLAAPVMHPVQVRLHHFFVPYRLVWETWEDFITGESASQPPVEDSSTALDTAQGSITDWLGIPSVDNLEYNTLHQRAVKLVWNEFYRDQDLQTELDITSDNSGRTCPYVCWEKDYFTSARPWAQKGDEITLPLGTEAPVLGIGSRTQSYSYSNENVYETGASGTRQYASSLHPGTNESIEEDPNNSGYPYIRADLTSATAASVAEIRRAFALQRYNEARARYGSRYVEYLRAAFGVQSSDGRLSRPEYLGGGKQTISFSEVLSTNDQGTLGAFGGHGIAALRSNAYMRFFEEHGVVLSLLSVRPKAMYNDGLPRKFSKSEKEDYYQKELAFIGQQEVLNKEVYADPSDGQDDDTFGYQDRYAEYRSEPSRVTTGFRSTYDDWHLGRVFASRPALNSTFVQCAPTVRVFQDQVNPPLLIMANHKIGARRRVPASTAARVI